MKPIISHPTLTPNPAHKYATLSWKSYTTKEATLQLHNVWGRIVTCQKFLINTGVNEITLDTSELEPNIYYVSVCDTDGTQFIQQLIVKH
ncbi:MAG: T9SS type A sorting domain-containing protein [Chitinophagales bacterium]|nr:T9SS type A sorting domain-containing protein [Chitinophagales bacterium]MDW8418477.1 T9SS type A sorting domain-containing protein [Chitinophagales bacterium]